MVEFGLLNWSVLIVYLIGNLYLGFRLSKRVASAEDFFLGQRNIPWWAIGISVVATYVSALSFLGGPAWSYSESLAVVLIHINYPIVIFLVVTYFLPFFFNSRVASIYEYQERRFGPASRSVMAAIFLVSQALTSAAILYATALVLQFITGTDVATAIVVVTLIALIYTVMGGIAAVIWTDVVQALVLLVGAGIIIFGVLAELPDSLGDTLRNLSAQGKLTTLEWSVDLTREATVWTGVIAMTLFHTTVYGANQMMVQRTLAAKSLGDAKKSFLLMGYCAFFIYFLFMFLGILLFAYYEGKPFENGNTIVLSFAAEYGLPGLMGVIAAAVVAASMSSLDSSLNSMATVSVVDFYQRYVKADGSDDHYLKASRWFTLLWALLIIGPALLYAQSEGSILQTLSKVGSYFVGAKLAMFGLGFFSKHTTERGLLVGVVVGFVVIWFVAANTTIAWPWYCLIGGGVNVVVALGASLLLDGRQERLSEYTVAGQRARMKASGEPLLEQGWGLMPGHVDAPSWGLLVFFLFSLGFLAVLEFGFAGAV
ncbi:MAG: sodium/solute symporter [Pseudomonadota bacterium]